MRSNDKKQKVIKKAKHLFFRTQISEAASSSNGLWRLVKWACIKSQALREIPKMPPSVFNNCTANTFEEKIDMLKASFFPPPPEADLSDIESYTYPQPAICPLLITKMEMLTAIQQPKADKAPGPDGIPNRLLQACAEKLSEMLTPLFQACSEQGYHPSAFKKAHTIALKKPPPKRDYTSLH